MISGSFILIIYIEKEDLLEKKKEKEKEDLFIVVKTRQCQLDPMNE